ncbi:MAG: serine/threonine-protein kinase [Victivallaceae bacterium]|nr:serine/threonine-protein kinase [Victivallaceae bacterium]
MAEETSEKYNFSHLKKLGPYRLIRHLGIGGMGEVYLAEHKSGEYVALKLLLPSLANNRHHIELFLKEINLLGAIKHPGIVRALDAGVQDDVCFFAMDFIDGYDLTSLIDGDAVSEKVALRIIRETAVILRDVFKNYQVIHRDIKPENIMITSDGAVHLLDFGLSLAQKHNDEYNCGGIGTAQFSAPEQFAGAAIDFRADIYSLGVTLYQLLTKSFPYDGSTEDIKNGHLQQPVPDPRNLRSDISEHTVKIIRKAMGKKSECRYKSWNRMIADIDSALRKISPDSRFATIMRLPGMKRNLVALLVALVAFGGLIFYSHIEVARKNIELKAANLLKTVKTISKEDCQEALKILDELPPEMPEKFRTAVVEAKVILNQKIAEKKRYDQDIAVENALRDIRHKSYILEQQNNWAEARKLWESQLKYHEFKAHDRFASEAGRYLEYISVKALNN